jgi:hypothetical protein
MFEFSDLAPVLSYSLFYLVKLTTRLALKCYKTRHWMNNTSLTISLGIVFQLFGHLYCLYHSLLLLKFKRYWPAMSLQKPTSPAVPIVAGELTNSLETQKTSEFIIHCPWRHSLMTCFLEEEIEKSVIKDFLAAMEYHTPKISTTNEAIETAMRNEMCARKMQGPKLEKTIHLASSLAEVSDS